MRLFITTLSMGSVIAFGYALAGYGGSLFGREVRVDYISLGLLLGFAFAGLALWLWYRHREEFFFDGSSDGIDEPRSGEADRDPGEGGE